MKKLLSHLTITSIILMGTISFAFVVGVEPPENYMNNLKNCTPSTVKTQGTTIDEYTIKGILPDGRCEVIHKNYTNFANPQVYENFITIVKDFGGDNIKDTDIPTQAQMIEQGKAEAITETCKFTSEQRNALYAAYLKKDGKNPCITKPNGLKSCRFSTNNMSSYDKLMLNYQQDTCRYIEIKKPYKRRAVDK